MIDKETGQAFLDCSCGGEQPHRLTYVHGCLLTITCEHCGRTTHTRGNWSSDNTPGTSGAGWGTCPPRCAPK